MTIPSDQVPEDQQPLVETAAQMLYGLIHARFILTRQGMAAMLEKYDATVYGTCPLYQCEQINQAWHLGCMRHCIVTTDCDLNHYD